MKFLAAVIAMFFPCFAMKIMLKSIFQWTLENEPRQGDHAVVNRIYAAVYLASRYGQGLEYHALAVRIEAALDALQIDEYPVDSEVIETLYNDCWAAYQSLVRGLPEKVSVSELEKAGVLYDLAIAVSFPVVLAIASANSPEGDIEFS
jgi:hypothetical protein